MAGGTVHKQTLASSSNVKLINTTTTNGSSVLAVRRGAVLSSSGIRTPSPKRLPDHVRFNAAIGQHFKDSSFVPFPPIQPSATAAKVGPGGVHNFGFVVAEIDQQTRLHLPLPQVGR